MLELSASVWPQTLAQLRSCGQGRNECVVYWLGPLADPGRVDTVIHPKHTATPWHYRIDPNWLTSFSFQLAEGSRTVRAQIHTHRGQAGHSVTDDEFPVVGTAGFISIVIPGFAVQELDLTRIYVAELRTGGSWVRRTPADVLRGAG